MWMLPNAESEPIAASGRKKKKKHYSLSHH